MHSRPPLRHEYHSRPIPASDVERRCRLIETLVAAAFAVTLDDVRAPTRRAPLAAIARQSAIYVARVALGLSYSDLGALFRRDRTTAAYACRLIEESREDAATDALFHALERACRPLVRS